jgi:CDP-glucose 4,6-dehydratase
MERQKRMIDRNFWKGKRVFVTGHTGFKGSWLCMWLHRLGANITGYSLAPPTDPSLFELAKVNKLVTSVSGDVRNGKKLTACLSEARPEIIFHLAAQTLVRDSYLRPVETYETNVMGTVNVLEAVRLRGDTVRALINITTDKVYENVDSGRPHQEKEPLGGYDPYSSSKACSELVTAAYRNSYFNPDNCNKHGPAVATARAGNVIGGGDWATDRIIPDSIKAFLTGKPVLVRNPKMIRPWQHVLEPLSGYLCLAERLCKDGPKYAEGWNFGPVEHDCRTVEYLVKTLCATWGPKATFSIGKAKGPREACLLKLDCSKARARLGWRPRWNLEKAIATTVSWYKAYAQRSDVREIREICLNQIDEFENTAQTGK